MLTRVVHLAWAVWITNQREINDRPYDLNDRMAFFMPFHDRFNRKCSG